MPLVTNGLNNCTAFIAAGLATAYVGVGDGTTTFSTSQTALQGSNTAWQPLDSGFPTQSANVITFSATWSLGSGNFSWNEWGIALGSGGSNMMSRIVQSLGTKTNTQSWDLDFTVTLAG